MNPRRKTEDETRTHGKIKMSNFEALSAYLPRKKASGFSRGMKWTRDYGAKP
jgi:hypothetical protein